MINKGLLKNRFRESLGIVLIGDGVVGLLDTQRHTKLWQSGPDWWREAMKPFTENPNLTRAFSIAEIGFGLWLASRQKARKQEETRWKNT